MIRAVGGVVSGQGRSGKGKSKESSRYSIRMGSKPVQNSVSMRSSTRGRTARDAGRAYAHSTIVHASNDERPECEPQLADVRSGFVPALSYSLSCGRRFDIVMDMNMIFLVGR